jgi:non-lysosomal glucosylceramidase
MAGAAVAALLATSAANGQAVSGVSATSPDSSKGGAQLGALSERDFFKVPDAALVRPLGDIAPNQGTPFPVPFKGTPGLGIPLGGMGAGSFMINQSGTFGPWSFNGSQGKSWEMRSLPQAAFHVREQAGNQAATVRTLAADGPTHPGSNEPTWQSPLPAWNELHAGEGSYAALYPFGVMSYEPFQTDVSMRFFSPIEAGRDRRTSLPVAYFDIRLANHTSSARTVSTMFTMPNAPAHVDGTHADESVPSGPTSVRTGFSSRYQRQGGIHAVTLSADSPQNTPDAAESEWTIAAKVRGHQKFSYTTSWNADGSGADVYRPFSDSGVLPNGPIDSSKSAGAIAVTAKLKPGEVTTIPFVLAWDFPVVGFDNNRTLWMRHYTNFYGARETATNDYVAGSYPFHQGFEIASDALRERTAALAAVNKWWKPIATETAYPPLLRTAALNQLSEMVWNNSFWEGGLVHNETVPDGFSEAGPGQHLNASIKDSHLYGIQDTIAGGVSGMGETTDIQAYNYRAYFHLFPNVQRDRLLAQIESVQRSPNGNAHDLYTLNKNPYITWVNAQDAFIQGGTDSRPPQPGRSQWLDSPSKFMFQWYAFAQMTNDRPFLRQAWPAMKSEIAWLKGTIAPGGQLPSEPFLFSNPFNIVPQGPGPALFNSELYLLALNIAIATGEQLEVDQAYVEGLRSDLAAARAEFESVFWDPATQHYRFSSAGPYSDAATIAAFYAQHLAESVGLPDVVDPDRHRVELTVHHPEFRSFNAAGDMIGAPLLTRPGGLANPDGSIPFVVDWVVVGDNYVAAADYFDSGERYGAQQLQDFALELGEGVSRQIWLKPENGLAFAAPWAWFPHDTRKYIYPGYSQALAVWDLLQAIKPLDSL